MVDNLVGHLLVVVLELFLELYALLSKLGLLQLDLAAGVAKDDLIVEIQEGGGLELSEFAHLEAFLVKFVEDGEVGIEGGTVYAGEDEGRIRHAHF
jgi:hypothetical protein